MKLFSRIKFSTFKSPRPFQISIDIFDRRGDGYGVIAIGLLWRTVEVEWDFDPDRIKTRITWKLFK